jgi:hypothetical protein
MRKHTPGPWFAALNMSSEEAPLVSATDPDLDGNGPTIAAALGEFPKDEDNANVVLMSAAPDMLDALEEAADELDAIVSFDPGKNYGGPYSVDDATRIADRIRRLIAKVGGGAP